MPVSTSGKRYSSVEEFYDELPVRRRSGELDFGVNWHEEAGEAGALFGHPWLLALVLETGELYAKQLGHGPDFSAAPVELLAVFPGGRAEAERVLAGWELLEHPQRTLDWVRRSSVR